MTLIGGKLVSVKQLLSKKEKVPKSSEESSSEDKD